MCPTPAANVSQLQTLDCNITGPNSLYTAAYGKEFIYHPIIPTKHDHAHNLREKSARKSAIFWWVPTYGNLRHFDGFLRHFCTFSFFQNFAFFLAFSHFLAYCCESLHSCQLHLCRNQLISIFSPNGSCIHQTYQDRLVGRRDLYSGGTFKCRFPRK